MKRILLPLCLFLPQVIVAQTPVTASGSALVRYGDGHEAFGSFSRQKDYLESLTDVRVGISDLTVGFRLLFDSPPEYGVEFAGVSKRFIEFTKEDLYLRGGTTFALFGRGLSLNLFENRALGFDNGLDGVNARYSFWKVDLAAVAGDIAYRDNLDLSRVENYRIRAGSILVSPLEGTKIGFSFVSGTYHPEPSVLSDLTYRFDLPEVSVALHLSHFDLYAAYALKRTGAAPGTPSSASGTGVTGSVSYVEDALGVTFEYKDYRFGIADPLRRLDPNRPDRAFAFQHPPIVHREHTATLMTRYPHVIDYNDEVGMQVDFFATLFDRLTGSVNGSVASRHFRWLPAGGFGTGGLPLYTRQDRDAAFLPSLSPQYSPFWEAYAELQYFLNEEGTEYALLACNRRTGTTADEANMQPTGPAITETRLWDIPLVFQRTVLPGLSLQFVIERQWVRETVGTSSDYHNQFYSLLASYQPGLSLAVRYETTSSEATQDGRSEWFAADVGYRLGSSHTVGLTVGTERGGLVCSNGVCRLVNPFQGFRAYLVSYF